MADAYSEAGNSAAGSKTQNKAQLVKAYLLDKGWGKRCVQTTTSITKSEAKKDIQKPRSYKEMLSRYSEEEFQHLLETGGITEVPHSKNSSLAMYVDNGILDWIVQVLCLWDLFWQALYLSCLICLLWTC